MFDKRIVYLSEVQKNELYMLSYHITAIEQLFAILMTKQIEADDIEPIAMHDVITEYKLAIIERDLKLKEIAGPKYPPERFRYSYDLNMQALFVEGDFID